MLIYIQIFIIAGDQVKEKIMCLEGGVDRVEGEGQERVKTIKINYCKIRYILTYARLKKTHRLPHCLSI